MQLRRLRVRNIRSYESAELTFTEGTTLLVGDVGSGKTSLLYAIEMALFGVAEVNGAYLVRHGAREAEVSVEFEGSGKRYEISRRFRRLRRKGQETFEAEKIRFTVDGAETSYSATELRQQVIELLGFPDNPSPQAHSDLWRWAVYVPQERMRDILGARPQERLETVRKALGVERYRTAADNAQELATDLRRSAGSRRGEAERLRHFDDEHSEASGLADQLRQERSTIERSLKEREHSVGVLRADRSEREVEVRRSEADLRELSSLEREAAADRQTLEARQKALSERGQELARRQGELEGLTEEAGAVERRHESLHEAESELRSSREELERVETQLRALAEARARFAAAEQAEIEARRALAGRQKEEATSRRAFDDSLSEGPPKEPPAPTPDSLAVIDEKLSVAHGREAGALQGLTRAESDLGEIDELLSGGVCPRCHQAVRREEFEDHRAEASALVRVSREALETRAGERAQLEAERRARERFERALERWKEVERLRAANRAAWERAVRAREEAEQISQRAGEERVLLAARLNELSPLGSAEHAARERVSRAEELVRRRSELHDRARLAAEQHRGASRAVELLLSEHRRLAEETEALAKRVTERGERTETLRAGQRRDEEIREAFGRAERELRAAEEALASERSASARSETRLEEAVRRMRAAETGRRERVALTEEAAELEAKASWVGGPFRLGLLEMEQQVLTHAQALFEREFARYFASLVDDPALLARTDPAFTPLVMIEGEWTPAEALSGGERTSLALAFRLALAHVVRTLGSLHLDTILLDEPTDGFSPEQVVRMGELLEELALPQVVLVSHESQLAAIADRVIRVQKVEGRSTLTEGSGARGPPAAGPILTADAD